MGEGDGEELAEGEALGPVAVLACMDPRLDIGAILGRLGVDPAQAYVLRNAGGLATEDALRSLVISQRLLGTTGVILLHHTDCGMTRFTDAELADRLESETGVRPGFAFGAFADVARSVQETSRRIQASPFLASAEPRGYVYDVATGALDQVV